MEIHLARDGSSLGIFTEAEVREGLAAGTFRGSDLAWRQGMDAWAPLGEWPDFAGVAAPALPGGPPALALPAWERGASVRHYLATMGDVMLRPVRTFEALPRGDVGKALGYQYAACLLTWVLASLAFTVLILAALSLGLATSELDRFRELGVAGPFAVGFLTCLVLGCAAVLLPLLNFVTAGILHLLLLPWGPSGDYAQTYRATGYVQGAFLPFRFIPCLNYLALPWSMVCTLLALSRVHRLAWWKVALSLVLPACALAIPALAFLVLMIRGLN
jgi:hypothetical protein